MQSWGRNREVEKIKQVSIATLPDDQQEGALAATDVASEKYPSVPVDGGCSVHVFVMRGEWEIWLNNEDHDFTGLCLAVGDTRDEALAQAVLILESAVERLQAPPPRVSAQPCGCDPAADHVCETHR